MPSHNLIQTIIEYFFTRHGPGYAPMCPRIIVSKDQSVLGTMCPRIIVSKDQSVLGTMCPGIIVSNDESVLGTMCPTTEVSTLD